MSEDNQEVVAPSPAIKIRVWPAVLIIVAQSIVTVIAAQLGTQTLDGAIAYYIAPLVGAILLGIWWLFASMAPWGSRIIGVALYAALNAAVMFAQTPPDYRILMIILPALSVVTVIAIAGTSSLSWPRRKLITVAAMFGCAVVVSLLRIDGVSGALAPQVSWRWAPVAEETLEATAEATPTHTGGKASLPPNLRPTDWPGFRGPERNSIVRGYTFSQDWANSPPTELWRKPVGLGWSSFSVVGAYAFTQEQRGEAEVVVCYETKTGDEVWRNQVAARFNDPMGSGPRGTPQYYKGKLYTQGATGIVICLDASTGETLWSRNVMDDTGAKLPTWGFSSSPLMVDGKVVVYTGGPGDKGVVAYDAATGDVAWTSGSGSHGYSSGQLTTINGVPQILMSSNYGIQSLSPADGSILWEDPWDISDRPRVVQPLILGEGEIIAGTGLGVGARLLSVSKGEGGWSVEEKWTSKRFRPYFNDFIYYDGFCYGYDGNRIACINVETGERAWNGANLGGQVLLVEDMGILLILAEDGEVILAEADPSEYKEITRISALSSKTWNHPVIADGKLFIRNDQEAVCYKLPVGR